LLNIEIDNTLCIVVVSVDITERKKAEERLKMNALLILKTTKAATCRITIPNFSKRTKKEKRAAVNQCQQ
jgi:hypothetical protein